MIDYLKYSTELTNLLKDYIRSQDHIDTGALYNSIDFLIQGSDDSFTINLTCNGYIIYLDEGTFLESFYNLDSVSQVIDNLTEEYINEKIEKDIWQSQQ